MVSEKYVEFGNKTFEVSKAQKCFFLNASHVIVVLI